jgi:hypothetical protein
MTTSCDAFHLVVSGDQCSSIATEYGISLAEFYRWNPAVGTSCESLDLGYYVCVDIIGVTPTTTSSASATTTTSGNGITTPTPFQANMTTSCDTFHLVVSGDQCSTIVTEYGISLTEFYNWNPAVGTSCESLDLGDYVCVDIIGLIITTSPISTMPTTTGNGISTPTPYQTGMATNCDRFYLVVSGDECGTIASDSGISLADFYAWNPAVGTSCESLDLGDYVCIDIIGVTPSTTTPTTTTTAGNGITTPTPYQTGMATNCDSFHLVISGDECATIALEAGVSLADFYAWNPAVGTSCESLDLGDYVCIDIIGVTPTTSTTAPTTTSSNGVSTPTPFQAGMVTDCDSFHLVVSGDECGTIATDADITLTEFYDWNPAVGDTCATLDLGYYVCIGLL